MEQHRDRQADLSSTSQSGHAEDDQLSLGALVVDDSTSTDGVSTSSMSTADTSLRSSEMEVDDVQAAEAPHEARSPRPPSHFPLASVYHLSRDEDL
jgi:hypothetical protein